MRFSTSAIASILSLSVLAGASPWASEDSGSFSLEARDAYALDYDQSFGDLYARDLSEDLYARDFDDEYFGAGLLARGKRPKVDVKLTKGKLNSKDRQTAEAQAEDALAKYNLKAGTIIYAYHLSNGESVEHITIEPSGGGKKIHAYRDGIFTQGDERRPSSRSSSPSRKGAKRDLDLLELHRRNFIAARDAYAEAQDLMFDTEY